MSNDELKLRNEIKIVKLFEQNFYYYILENKVKYLFVYQLCSGNVKRFCYTETLRC